MGSAQREGSRWRTASACLSVSRKGLRAALAFLVCVALPVAAQPDLAFEICPILDSMADNYYQPALTVAFGTFTYGYTGLGSSYSLYLEDLLSKAMAESNDMSLVVRSVVQNMDPEFRELYTEFFETASVDALLYGRFWEDDGNVRVDLELTSLTIGELIGRTSLYLSSADTPAGVAVLPPGLTQAAELQTEMVNLLSINSGNLVVKATTSRGDGAVYTDGENLTLHVFVSEDAYLKIYHVGVAGVMQLMFPNQYHPQNRVEGGSFTRIPGGGDQFELLLGPPYGVEYIKVIASTVQFDDMEQSFSDLGNATRGLLTRGLSVTTTKDREGAETLVQYSIVGGIPDQ
jgi:uncharacterized protein DUF4384